MSPLKSYTFCTRGFFPNQLIQQSIKHLVCKEVELGVRTDLTEMGQGTATGESNKTAVNLTKCFNWSQNRKAFNIANNPEDSNSGHKLLVQNGDMMKDDVSRVWRN